MLKNSHESSSKLDISKAFDSVN
jgi:hypothetical protein